MATYSQVTRRDWSPQTELKAAALEAIAGAGPEYLLPKFEQKRHLLALINDKLDLNKTNYQGFLDLAAGEGITFNYHEKLEIADAFNYSDIKQFSEVVRRRTHSPSLISSFASISKEETIEALHGQLQSGKVKRSDARQATLEEREEEVLGSLFGSFVFKCFPVEKMHGFFAGTKSEDYIPDFYKFLKIKHHEILNRDCALVFAVIDKSVTSRYTGSGLRDWVCSLIKQAYDQLSNHCCLALLIKDFKEGHESGQWNLFSDIVLFAEKHKEVKLRVGYFRPDEIATKTSAHIPTLNREHAQFETAHEGFQFKDCIVIPDSLRKEDRSKYSAPVDILLVFDKNERDERKLPCPACRSYSVTGNSYPSLGVKSWECKNLICPDRSAFARGNRYSLSSLIKQEAITDVASQIPEASLKRWKLDVVPGASAKETFEMLLRHFTLSGDKVLFVGDNGLQFDSLGRSVGCLSPQLVNVVPGIYDSFTRSCFFKRFILPSAEAGGPYSSYPSNDSRLRVFLGKCEDVLTSVKANSLDGAVTSPPYYNAKTYSTWPNIYAYLYDMLVSAREVYRVLKPGAYYLYNIFDYFDNENILATSAMGKKRMILGPYIIHLFRVAGFQLIENSVWYKGEIEGKRNFNQGNKSPYYQLPFNCWEHVLVFRKPGDLSPELKFPTVYSAKPVIKMIRGENILGHPAPFPEALPDLLLSQLAAGCEVLDPYAGSLTTARVALKYNQKSIAIDLHSEYCEIGMRLINEAKDKLFAE